MLTSESLRSTDGSRSISMSDSTGSEPRAHSSSQFTDDDRVNHWHQEGTVSTSKYIARREKLIMSGECTCSIVRSGGLHWYYGTCLFCLQSVGDETRVRDTGYCYYYLVLYQGKVGAALQLGLNQDNLFLRVRVHVVIRCLPGLGKLLN